MKDKFIFFGPASFVYACFFTFCMYRNGSGVTFPFFVAGSLWFFYLSVSKLGTTLKKGSGFYMAAMLLLGLSTFCTDDGRLIFFNKLGIFLLMMSLQLKQFCDTENWGLGKYFGSICKLVAGCIGEFQAPFKDADYYRKNLMGKPSKKAMAILAGILTGLPLTFVVLLLLSSADALFRQMTDRLLQPIGEIRFVQPLVYTIIMFLTAYGLLSFLCKNAVSSEVKEHKTGEPVLAITVTSMLTVLYLVFSMVQVFGLFLGKMQLPEGYSYAAYAREGFFQLLAVSFLNMVIVLVALGYFRESKPLKVILTIMSLCTYILIASSAFRMILYIKSYHLTFLRILVLWSLALLAVLFAGIIVQIFKESFPLFRYSMIAVTLFYLVLSFAHPDYIIAKVNLTYANDFVYLGGLSADAAPVLVPYLKENGYDMELFEDANPVQTVIMKRGTSVSAYSSKTFGYYWMEKMHSRVENMGIRSFNLSRYLMLKLMQN